MPDEIPDLLDIHDLQRLAPRACGRTLLYKLLQTHGVRLTARRVLIPRAKFEAWLAGNLPPLPTTTPADRIARKIQQDCSGANDTGS